MNKVKNTAKWLRDIAQEVENDPSRWTQGECARDANGRHVIASSDEAVCWCLLGFSGRDDMYYEVTRAIKDEISTYNDDLKGHTEFVTWLRNVAENL